VKVAETDIKQRLVLCHYRAHPATTGRILPLGFSSRHDIGLQAFYELVSPETLHLSLIPRM